MEKLRSRKAEVGEQNGLRGRNDLSNQAFGLDIPNNGIRFEGLTIESSENEIRFRLTGPSEQLFEDAGRVLLGLDPEQPIL